jgi:hypothetical protein
VRVRRNALANTIQTPAIARPPAATSMGHQRQQQRVPRDQIAPGLRRRYREGEALAKERKPARRRHNRTPAIAMPDKRLTRPVRCSR